MRCADRVQPRLNLLHVIDIFHRAFLAGGDDQSLFAVHERNFRDFLNRHEAEVILGFGSDINERPQTVVLAEMATRVLVARSAVLDLAHRVQADKRRLLTVAPQPQRFLRGADGPRLSTMLVHNNLRLFPGSPEAIADDGLHDGQIVLRSTLQDKA